MKTQPPTSRRRDDTGGWWRAEGATARPSRLRPPARRPAPAARGFTLTELLIVIGLIVMVLALAVPAFRAMTGGRSIDAAQNQLAAVLGAARAEAIGLQKTRGVFFYIDPATERVTAVLVQDANYDPRPGNVPPYNPGLYLDLVPDRDPLALPVGIGLQGIDNSNTSGSPPARNDDGYIGFNPMANLATPPPSHYGGVVLFDGYGRVVQKEYGLLLGREVLVGSARVVQPTRLGELLGYAPGSTPPEWFVAQQELPGTPSHKRPAQSLFGFVLFDAEPFRAAGRGDSDPQLDPSSSRYRDGDESREETWLDENAVPVLISRHSGSLIRGQ